MSKKDKSKAIILIEKLRLIESEIFRLSSSYGVKTVDELDELIEKGKFSEKEVGDDLFIFDNLLAQKEEAEKELNKLGIKKESTWENLQNLLGLPKLNFQI